MKRFFVLSLVALSLASAPAFAQRTAKQTGTVSQAFTLTINVNVIGSFISVDGNGLKGNVVNLAAGNHSVQVTANGYKPYSVMLNLQSNQVLNVSLEAALCTLSVSVNVKAYFFSVDGAPVKGNAVNVQPGTHQVSVDAPGYVSYSATVNVNQSMNLNVVLQASLFDLGVNVNVKGYAFFVDGQAVKGNIAQVMPGNHQVKVQAPGYVSYETTVNVNQSMNLNIALQPDLCQLNVFCDVIGVSVFIDDALQNNFPVSVAPGKYSIRAKAKGYAEYREDIAVKGDYNLKIQMKQLMGSIVVVLPVVKEMRDLKDIKGNRLPAPLPEIMVDNQPARANQRIELVPGQHRVRVSLSGLVSETDLLIEAGMEYNIEPQLEFKISNANAIGKN